jgi:hypothetical protein
VSIVVTSEGSSQNFYGEMFLKIHMAGNATYGSAGILECHCQANTKY